jgi:hypothetical protein
VTAIDVYVNQIRQKQEALSRKLGSWLPGMPAEYRVILTLLNIPWAAVAKLLVDKGVFTDAELLAALNAAAVAAWNAENPQPTPGPSEP